MQEFSSLVVQHERMKHHEEPEEHEGKVEGLTERAKHFEALWL